jgi:hypothetical protein
VSFVDPDGRVTSGGNLTITIALGPIGGTISFGFVNDSKGNAGVEMTYGSAKGFEIAADLNVQATDAPTLRDLASPAVSVSATPAAFPLGVSIILPDKSNGLHGADVSGPGVGFGVSVKETDTKILSNQNAEEVVFETINELKTTTKLLKALLSGKADAFKRAD